MTAAAEAGARGGEAIGLIELSSIAQGLLTCDAMVKMAYVELFEAKPFSSGKYMVLIGGDVASVQSSIEKGLEIAREALVDHLFIPYAHADLFPAMRGEIARALGGAGALGALGAIETASVAATILAADAAAKAASVRLLEIRLGQGIGGKGYFTLTGSVASVEAAIAAGASSIARGGQLIQRIVIPAPHEEMLARIFA